MTSLLTELMIYNAIAVLGLVGVVGNVVSLVIWTRPSMKSSASVYLVGIAVSDLVIDSIYIIRFFILTILYYSPNSDMRYLFCSAFIAWGPAVFNVARIASTYLTLAISFERHVAVCRPFEFRQICTHSRARKYTLGIFIVSILYRLPLFLAENVVASEGDNGETVYDSVPTDLSRSPQFQTIFELQDTWLRLFLDHLLPLSCISVLTVLIYLELKKSEELRMALSTSQIEENKTTRMLVYVVFEFLFCSAVGMFYSIMEILEISEKQLGVVPSILAMLDEFFFIFNSSSNIFVYAVFGRSFRKTLLTTFSWCLRFCHLKLPTRGEDRELGLRMPTTPTSQPSDRNQVAEVCV